MSSFRDRFGQLTVAQVKELNEAAKWFCNHEVTAEGGKMKLFKHKPIKPDYKAVAEALAQLEPKRMERLVEIAKDIRTNKRDLDVFVNGRPDDIERIVKEAEDVE